MVKEIEIVQIGDKVFYKYNKRRYKMSNIGTIELDDLIYPITPADQIEKELDNFNTGVKELMEEFANKTGAYIESIDVSSFYSSSGSVNSRFMLKGIVYV